MPLQIEPGLLERTSSDKAWGTVQLPHPNSFSLSLHNSDRMPTLEALTERLQAGSQLAL